MGKSKFWTFGSIVLFLVQWTPTLADTSLRKGCGPIFEITGGLTTEIRRSEARHGLFSRQSQEIVTDAQAFDLLLGEIRHRNESNRRHARAVISDSIHKHNAWSEILREEFHGFKHLGKKTAIELFGDFFHGGQLTSEETSLAVQLLVGVIADNSAGAHYALKEAALDSLFLLPDEALENVSLVLADDLSQILSRGSSDHRQGLRILANLSSSIAGTDILISILYKPQRRRLLIAPAFPRPRPLALQLLELYRDRTNLDESSMSLMTHLAEQHPSLGVRLRAAQIVRETKVGWRSTEALERSVSKLSFVIEEGERAAHEVRREQARLRASGGSSHLNWFP